MAVDITPFIDTLNHYNYTFLVTMVIKRITTSDNSWRCSCGSGSMHSLFTRTPKTSSQKEPMHPERQAPTDYASQIDQR